MRVTLADIQDRYEGIMIAEEGPIRDKRLSDLMDFMKSEFNIPLMQNREWEQEHKAVIAMYRKISLSRSL